MHVRPCVLPLRVSFCLLPHGAPAHSSLLVFKAKCSGVSSCQCQTLRLSWKAMFKWKHPCVPCKCLSFLIFGTRADFTMDVCHLFPQCMLAVIPLREDVQVRGLHRLQEGGGSSWCPIPAPSAAGAVCVGLWSLKMAAEAHTHPWSMCRWRPAA